MNRNYIIFLIITVLFIFTSCVTFTNDYELYAARIGYEYSGEKPFFINAGLSDNQTHYTISLFIEEINEVNTEFDLEYIYISKLCIVLPLGKKLDILNEDITVKYFPRYVRNDRRMPKEYKNKKPQYMEGKRIISLDDIGDTDSITLTFNSKIPVLANSFRLEYALTTVWENSIEEIHQGSLLFKRVLEKWYWFTV